MLLKVGEINDGRRLCAVFNTGFDRIEKLRLFCDFDVKEISMLMPNGTERKVEFSRDGDLYTLDIPCYTLEPVILFVR